MKNSGVVGFFVPPFINTRDSDRVAPGILLETVYFSSQRLDYTVSDAESSFRLGEVSFEMRNTFLELLDYVILVLNILHLEFESAFDSSETLCK